MKFYIGQPVVLVRDDWPSCQFLMRNITFPVRGTTYHVRGYLDQEDDYGKYILLREVRNRDVIYGTLIYREAAWGEGRFEPLTKKTVSDIIATALDVPTPDDLELVRELETEDA